MLTDCRVNGNERTVTFANGLVLTELLISLDDAQHRIVYSVVNGSFTHHNASMQLRPSGRNVEFVWITDFLPDEVKSKVEPLVDAGCAAIKRSLETSSPS